MVHGALWTCHCSKSRRAFTKACTISTMGNCGMALRVHICSQAIKSMNDDDEEENQASEEVQDYRRDLLLNQMLEAAQATNRAAKLVSNIVARNQDRMFLDKSGRILVNGTLATYRVDMGAFLNKMNNPLH